MPSRFRPKSTRSSAARSQRSLPAMGDQLHSRDRAKAGRSKCEGRNYRARAEFWRGMEPRHRGIDVTKMPANKAFSQSRGPRAGHARSRRSFAPILATKQSYWQDVFSGSDGTRTRELRRDRPAVSFSNSRVIEPVRKGGVATLSSRNPASAAVRNGTLRL